MATIRGDGMSNTLIGGPEVDQIFGEGGDDILDTGASDGDTLDGGDGNDTLIARQSASLDGGAGGNDLADFRGSSGVTADLSAGTYTSAEGSGTLIRVEQLYGGVGADLLIGDTGNNVLFGGDGADQLAGGDGNDILDGGSSGGGVDVVDGGGGTDTLRLTGVVGVVVDLGFGQYSDNNGAEGLLYNIENVFGSASGDVITGDLGDNVLSGNGGADQLFGLDGTDTLNGGDGNDGIDGGDGNDFLNGGLGDDVIAGDLGFDTVTYATARGAVTVNLTTNSATGADGTDTLSGIENVTGSNFNDTLVGDAGANVLTGGAGGDVLDGGLGDDTLNGGLGFDTATYASADSGQIVDLGQGYANSRRFALDTLVSIENVIGSDLADIIRGDAGNNVLNGGAGDDELRGLGGVNILDGGAGFDTLSYDWSTAGVRVSLAVTTTQNTGASIDRIANIERLVGSQYDDVLAGDALNNTLVGAGANDVLDGGLGNDGLDGGDGIDTASYTTARGAVTVDLRTGLSSGAAGSDTLSGIENVTGSNFNDMLTGDDGANVLTGGAGSDVLVGGLGRDVLDGGLGLDTADYSSVSGKLYIALDSGTVYDYDTAESDTLIGIENVVAGGGDDTLYGNNGDNVLTGGGGNDQLFGAGGLNVLDGGAGIDTAYYFNSRTGVTVSLAITGNQATGAGVDRLVNIENLLGSNYADVLVGDSGNNRINGGSGDDRLSGGAGNDELFGGAGADRLIGGAGMDTMAGGYSFGADRDPDTFVFLAIGDSTVAGADRITDLTGQDIIDLTAIDANTRVAGNQAFALVDQFTGAAGQLTLTYTSGTNTTRLLGDVNGDGVVDFAVDMSGDTTGMIGGWLL